MQSVNIIAVIGQDNHSSSWGKTFVFVVNEDGTETHIYKMPGVSKKEVWSQVRHGSYTEVTVKLPEGTKLKMFRDGGDKHGRRREYRRKEEANNLYFQVSASAEEQTFEGDGAHYTGSLTGRLLPLEG